MLRLMLTCWYAPIVVEQEKWQRETEDDLPVLYGELVVLDAHVKGR